MNNKIFNWFEEIEQDNIIQSYRFKNTSTWIDIKNYIYSKSLDNVIQGVNDNSKQFVTLNAVVLVFLSLFYYIKSFFLKKDTLFVGAGSGLMEFEGKTVDEYLPKEIDLKRLVYWVSADYPQRLWWHIEYIKKNNIVIFSFLLAPLKVIFTKIFKYFSKFNLALNGLGFEVSKKELQYIHTRFIVSYYLYKIFLFPFRFKKAYIVSAYSNSPLIAVLKEKGVKIIEIQHGIIGPMHRGYNYTKKDPLLPTPDTVYVYNKFWKDELIEAGYYLPEQIEVKGRLKYELIKKDIVIKDGRFIVFTGQGGFYNEINRLLKDASKVLKQHNIKLLYLPHPNESKEQLSQLHKSDAVEILSQKRYITEQYIYNSLAHISVYSSCHFDAIHYKNKTFVFDIMKENPMHYYTKHYSDKFIAIKDIDEVLSYV